MHTKNHELLITIDVEPDCDTKWNRSDPLTFESVLIGIPKILRPIWNKYGIKPIYFVSPEVVMNNNCCKVLKQEIKNGAIIGAHLHSEYIAPNVTIEDPAGKPSKEYPCYAHSTKVEYEKIKNLTNLIKKNLSVRPVWYRAARYGADLDTIKSLKKLGYKYDSSVTPHINWQSQGGPDHSKAPEQPYWILKDDYCKPAANKSRNIGIKEFPITISGKRFGILGRLLPSRWFLYNWIRPTHMTVFEMKRLIDKFDQKYTNPAIVMMFHSMEIMPGKSPFVKTENERNSFLKRLETIINYVRGSK